MDIWMQIAKCKFWKHFLIVKVTLDLKLLQLKINLLNVVLKLYDFEPWI